MVPFNKYLFFILIRLSIVTSLLLTACMKGPSKRNESETSNSTASFYIYNISGSSEVSQTDSRWNLESQKLFNFSVCLKDHAKNEKITGNSFALSIDEQVLNKKTDSDGCIQWSEKVNFNPLANPTYISLERKITARGLYRGSLMAKIAINPWNKNKPVVDLDEEQVTKLLSPEVAKNYLSGQYLENVSSKDRPFLWVDSLNFKLQEQKMTSNGLLLDFNLNAKPFLKTNNEHNQATLTPLIEGEVEVSFYFLFKSHSKKTSKRQIIAQSKKSINTSISGQKLTLRTPILFPQLPKNGEYEIALRVSPVNAPFGLKSFEGVFSVGNYKNLEEGSNLVAKSKHNNLSKVPFQLKDYVTNSSFLKNNNTKSLFNAEPLRIYYRGIDKTQVETSQWRTIKINFQTCIYNSFKEKYLQREFKVHKFQPEGAPFEKFNSSRPVASVKTDDQGCISWNDTIRHKYYSKEIPKNKTILLEDVQSGMKKTFTVKINPWDLGRTTFAQDGRLVNDTTKEALIKQDNAEAKNTNAPRLHIKNYLFNSAGIDYEIDNILNLTVKRKFNIMLWPMVIRHSIRKGIQTYEKLRTGHYLMRLILRKPKNDLFQPHGYIDSTDKIVMVENGRIAEEIEFKFREMEYMATRNNVLVEIWPIREDLLKFKNNKVANTDLENLIYKDSGLITPTISGPFIPFKHQERNILPDSYANITPGTSESDKFATEKIKDSDDLQTVVINSSKIIDNGKKELLVEVEQQKKYNIQSFVKRNRLDLIQIRNPKHFSSENIDTLSHLGITDQELYALINNEAPNISLYKNKSIKTLLQSLCNSWELDKLKKSEDLTEVFTENCHKDPSRYFVLDRKIHSKRISQKSVTYLGGHTENFGITNAFSIILDKAKTDAKTNSTYTDGSIAATVGFTPMGFLSKISNKLKKLVGLEVSATIRKGKNKQNIQTDSINNLAENSLSIRQGAFLLIQRASFNLTFTEYNRCLAISTHPSFHPAIQQNPKAKFGIYICLPTDNTPLNKTETFFMTLQHFNNGDLLDKKNIRNIRWMMLLRGFRDYFTFLGLAAQNRLVKEFNDMDTNAIKVMNEKYELFIRKYQMFPGTYTLLNNNDLSDTDLSLESLRESKKDVQKVLDGLLDNNSVSVE